VWRTAGTVNMVENMCGTILAAHGSGHQTCAGQRRKLRQTVMAAPEAGACPICARSSSQTRTPAATHRANTRTMTCMAPDLVGVVAALQAGALSSALLTKEPGQGLTMTTWSRMTTEAAKAPHQTATGL
jgi:hypothetical protein